MAPDFKGDRIAHYSISGKIGSGGMGEVYRARDTKLDRDVALKVLPVDVSRDPARLERFQREAKAIAALNHPNIVTIHSVEEADGVHFLTMELIEGESLDRTLTGEGLELARIFDIATPLADALATAHDRGIIHRDLKPANVMITREGRIKVLDFGLAKLAQASAGADDLTAAETRQAEVTSEGTVLGTLPYMSPEQVRGQVVDHRADIFALGVMLYEFVMGKRPFAGDTQSDLISSILRDEPLVVTDRRHDLPHHLGRIIGRCLEKDPERRYQSVKDVRNELELLRKEVDSGVSEVTPASGQGRGAGSGAGRVPADGSGQAPGSTPGGRRASDVGRPASDPFHGRASDPALIQASDPSRAIPSGIEGNRAKLMRFAIPAGVVIVAIVAILMLRPFTGSDKGSNVAVADDKSLAIMYFENVVDPEDPQRLGSIATSLLIADLSESQYVSVVSSQRLRDVLTQLGHEGTGGMDPTFATQVATTAGAKWMLMGTILRTEPTMVVTSQLVDVASGQVAASQRIVGEVGEEVFDIVDRLTVEVKQDLALPTEAMSEPDRPVADMTSHSQEAYRLYMEGVELFHQLLTEDAGEKMEEALAIDSTLAPAWLRRGLVRFFPNRGRLLGEYIDKAVQYADGAGRLDRFYIDAFAAASAGDDARAVATLERAQQQFPNEKELYLLMGTMKAFRMHDARGGVSDLERVVAMDPTYKMGWNYLAYEYANLGDRDESVAALDRYIALVPDEANPYDTAGDLYAIWGDLQKAIDMYETALQKSTFQSWTLRKLGITHMLTGDYEKAMESYRRIAAADNALDRAMGWFYLAAPAIRQGKFEDALAALDRAIAIHKVELSERDRSYDADSYRALILWEHGDRERAFEAMAVNVERRRQGLGTGLFEVFLVKMLVESGDLERASEVAEVLRDRVTGDRAYLRAYYHDALGSIALARGDTDAAVELFETAVSHSRMDNEIWSWVQVHLAHAYLVAERYNDAIAAYNAVLDRTSSVLPILIEGVKGFYYLGLAYEKSGDRGKAIASYERFLEIWRDGDAGLPLVSEARAAVERLRAGS
jgi:serine/threonine protein kinase/tetratricopeptide (TPR) repeat protein